MPLGSLCHSQQISAGGSATAEQSAQAINFNTPTCQAKSELVQLAASRMTHVRQRCCLGQALLLAHGQAQQNAHLPRQNINQHLAF
jgi:hypothetical protein